LGETQKTEEFRKKVAIIFHNYPPRNDTIGSAFGLDTKDSIFNLLKLLKENGYSIPDMPLDGDALINELLA
jgi:cobaltochelatase CobN